MNNKDNHDKIDFNGETITIKDLFTKDPRELLVHIVIELRALKNIPEKVNKNGRDLAWVKGVIAVLMLLTGYLISRII